MFGVLRAAIRAFVVGVAVGVLFAPRPGVETRKMLSQSLTHALSRHLRLVASWPVRPESARTNGHAGRGVSPKHVRAAGTDVRSPS